MEEFSREIHIAIASFLGVTDVVNYQSCNKQLRRMIHLHRLNRPSPIGNSSIISSSQSQVYLGVDDTIHLEEIIGSSFYFSNLIHSVKLSCLYRDQGWGNRKGQIYITEKPKQDQQQSEKDQEQQRKRRCFSLRQVDDDDESDDDDDDESDEDDDESDDDTDIGRIIAESPIAEHHETKYESSFRPKPGFMYCLCYRIGGGGGHTLIVRDIKLESFVHSACIPLANTLMDAPPTSPQSLFYRNMLQYVLDTVVYFENSETHCQQQPQEILLGRRPSLSFFQSVGLNLMDEHDVEAVRMLLAELNSN